MARLQIKGTNNMPTAGFALKTKGTTRTKNKNRLNVDNLWITIKE